MNLFELLIITLIASICTAFGYAWGAIMTIAKQEDERDDQQRMAAKHGDD